MCPLRILIIRKFCYVLFITAVTYSTMYMYILYATIPGPRVVRDAEFHIATEPNGCIEFHSIFLPKYQKKVYLQEPYKVCKSISLLFFKALTCFV